MPRGFLSEDHDANAVRRSDLVDIAAEVRAETAKAWLVFDGAREAWIAKAWAERNPDGTFTMPGHWAVEKGLI
jgi:hypothetical protein